MEKTLGNNEAPKGTTVLGDAGGKAAVLKYVDGLLRNRDDYFSGIFDNKHVARHVLILSGIIACLTAVYGLTMGISNGIPQMISSAIKVPILYLLTLLICYPVLYVVVVIMGSRLSFLQTLALILLALGLSAILLASCAPISLFFTVTGASYDFIKLLHVVVFGFCGAWGMLGLWRGLVGMCEASSLYPKRAVRILQVWILVFGFVGTQMTWSLRPFVGTPDLGFQVFRQGQRGNFYEAVGRSALNLFGPPEAAKPANGDDSQSGPGKSDALNPAAK